MLYINSVQVSKSSELLIDESNDEPSIKRRKMNEDTRYSSFNIKSLEELVMNLESRHSEKYDLWRNVLWALNKTGRENGYDTFEIADQFSKRSAKYKDSEDVKKTFESSDGTMSIHYLIDISKIYEEGLHIMEKYLSKKVPSIYLPLTLEQVDYRDPNKIRLTVNCSNISHTLFIIPDFYVLTDHNGLILFFLNTTISSKSSILKSVCPAMRGGFTVTLQEDDYEFVSRKNKGSFILKNPLQPGNASILFSNGQRGRKTTDLQCIYKALRKETMKFFFGNFKKPFSDDSACFVDIHRKNSNVIRDDTELVQALHAAKPSIKSRYRFSGNTIYYCRPETNVWEIIGEKKFDFQLRNYFTNTAELELTRAELKHISMKNSMTNLRNYILGEVDITDFANRLNSKLQLFITNNKTIDLSSTPPIIRHIEIEDLAKTTCGWSYNPDLAAIHKESVQSYFNTMFPEQSERDWILSYIARFLNGTRMNEPFIILIDEHEDKTGKTTLMQLLKAVFGNYFIANSKVVTAGGSRDYNEYAGGLYSTLQLKS
uniref:AsIV-cont00074-ORF1 n=1 Tax=Apophua simplicipes ichnovirus TaxID=1329648 RepID=S5DR85_9VIRU|nr:AsIV-cont00074-ORF1 [Apophua simplicipes ichnovirus]